MIIVPQSTTAYSGISNAVRSDQAFLQRVAVAAVNAALTIAAEASSTANYANRQALVPKVMQAPDSFSLQFAIAIALDQNLTSTGAPDSNLYAGALDVWDAMAGVA